MRNSGRNNFPKWNANLLGRGSSTTGALGGGGRAVSAAFERIAILRENGVRDAAAQGDDVHGLAFREALQDCELRSEHVAFKSSGQRGSRFFFDAIAGAV